MYMVCCFVLYLLCFVAYFSLQNTFFNLSNFSSEPIKFYTSLPQNIGFNCPYGAAIDCNIIAIMVLFIFYQYQVL